MVIRQGIAVCLLIAGASAATVVPTIDWSIAGDTVVAGSTATVRVDSAPQFPVEVRLYVDGILRDSADITTAGDSCDLDVPAGTTGLDWKIEVQSGSETDARRGTVG